MKYQEMLMMFEDEFNAATLLYYYLIEFFYVMKMLQKPLKVLRNLTSKAS